MIEQKFLHFFASHNLTVSDCLVAVSGGVDSMALLHLFLRCREKLGIRNLAVAHVHHGLRIPQSDEEESAVRNLALGHELPFFVLRLSEKNLDSSSIEAWGREKRYAFFTECMQLHGYAFTATGHTMDDQAETLLMRLERGTSTYGLRGITPLRKDRIIRPLLYIAKHEIVDWMKENRFEWFEDSTNSDTTFTRNRIRHELLSKLLKKDPHVREILSDLSRTVQRTTVFLEKLLKLWIRDHVIMENRTVIRVKKDPEHTLFFLFGFFCGYLCRYFSISCDAELISRLEIAIRNDTENKRTLLKNFISVYSSKKELIFYAEKEKLPETEFLLDSMNCCTVIKELGVSVSTHQRFLVPGKDTLSFDRSNTKIYLDRKKVCGTLVARCIRPSDMFIPLGQGLPVSCMAFLKKRSVPLQLRQCKTVIAYKNTNRVLWICGSAVSESEKVSLETTAILELEYAQVFDFAQTF